MWSQPIGFHHLHSSPNYGPGANIQPTKNIYPSRNNFQYLRFLRIIRGVQLSLLKATLGALTKSWGLLVVKKSEKQRKTPHFDVCVIFQKLKWTTFPMRNNITDVSADTMSTVLT